MCADSGFRSLWLSSLRNDDHCSYRLVLDPHPTTVRSARQAFFRNTLPPPTLGPTDTGAEHEITPQTTESHPAFSPSYQPAPPRKDDAQSGLSIASLILLSPSLPSNLFF